MTLIFLALEIRQQYVGEIVQFTVTTVMTVSNVTIAYAICSTKIFLAGQNQIMASQKHQNPIQK